ncbi:procollagen C-endopeptidase enhancer 2-like [Pecten maximus]|uniref:procollagen C-endopeptidase enhancer 2-like n=1 Tax=Pecten maximus TaxID=6579 RepID=UPI00145879CF|nr:procollagen C-endopeptidase enhancer 2-like [Pecten maximus]
MWISYLLLFAGTLHLGSGTAGNCCELDTSINAPINELKSIEVTCNPGFFTPCKWTVMAPPGAVIGVEISSVIVGTTTTVVYKNDAGNILGTFTSTNQIIPLRVAGQFFTVEITTAPLNTPPSGGEVLNFKYLAITSPAPDSAAACSSGETISLDTVTGGETCIASPNFPDDYPLARTTCRWRIETSDTIEYNVIFFHTERSDTCQYDFVKITVAGSTGPPQCDRQLQGVTQTGLASPVEVKFTFDDYKSFPGIFICLKKIGK